MPRKAQATTDDDAGEIRRRAPAGTTPRSSVDVLRQQLAEAEAAAAQAGSFVDDGEDADPVVDGMVQPVKASKPTAGQKRRTVPVSSKNTRAKPAAAAPQQTTARAASQRAPTREAARQPARDLSRHATRPGAVVVTGRDGEVLTRRRTTVGDKYHVPMNEVPQGWDYQWNPVTVLNKEMVSEQVMMYENGWRPVPAKRHPGRWFNPDHEGAIIVDGLRLEERPHALNVDAHQEDVMRAKSQVRDQTDALRLTQKQLPGSAEARGRNESLRMGMRMDIDPGFDIPKNSNYEIDPDA